MLNSLCNTLSGPITKASNAWQTISRHPTQTVRELRAGLDTEIRELPGGVQLMYVRDPQVMQQLAADRALDRGNGVTLLRSIFGQDAPFLMSHGKAHSRIAGEFNQHFSRSKIEALIPEIATRAVRSVDLMCEAAASAPETPVDLGDLVQRYLFDVGAFAITGRDVNLEDQVTVFRDGVDDLHREASMGKIALAAQCPSAAPYMAKDARRKAQQFRDAAGRQLLVEGAQSHETHDTFALKILKRHRIDAAGVTASTPLPEPALVEASMSLAASLFTTANMIERTLDHFQRHPSELRGLRTLIAQDFPDGAKSVTRLGGCPTLNTLLPILLAHTPVGVVARDVVKPTSFIDSDKQRRELRPGDAVVFDIEGMQNHLTPQLARDLADDPQSILSLFDKRHDADRPTFFVGWNQCPGRFLAVADSLLWLVESLSRLDFSPVEHDRPLERGIVNRLGGSSKATVRARPAPTGGPANSAIPMLEPARSVKRVVTQS